MKANKLAKAEFGKLFMRPAMYFLTAVLVIALIIVSLAYNPQNRENTSVNFGNINQSVSDIFSTFNDISSKDENAKINLDKMLESAKENLVSFNAGQSLHQEIITKVENINEILTASSSTAFYNLLISLANNPDDTSTKTSFINALENLRGELLAVYTFLDENISNQNIDFLTTQEKLSQLKDFYYDFFGKIPRDVYLQAYSTEELVSLGNLINKNYTPKLTSTLEEIKNFSKIEIKTEKIDEILKNYHTAIAFSENIDLENENEQTPVLNTIFEKAELFVEENSSSKEDEKIKELNAILTEYKNAVLIATNAINLSLNLEKIGSFSDKEINNYIGFDGVNSYALKEQLTFNNYLLENQIFDGSLSYNFSFSQTISSQTTGFDFAFFAMQILAVIITIFCIFFTVTSLAGEQSNGTMKMLAMRPYKKSKIVSGKILASIYFMLMLVLIAGVCAFVVGASMFGFNIGGNILLVFNATTAFVLPAFLVFIIYLICLAIHITFYILLASLLSIIMRSTSFATFATFIVYLMGIIFNATLANTAFFTFTPFAHLDLFRYLGGAEAGSYLFGVNSILDANFFISLGVVVAINLLLGILSKLIFAKRDIT